MEYIEILFKTSATRKPSIKRQKVSFVKNIGSKNAMHYIVANLQLVPKGFPKIFTSTQG